MKNTTFGKFVSLTAACLLAVTAAHAGNAIWQGGATGDIKDTGNWNTGANIAADYLNFSNNVTVTMSADATVYDVFGNKMAGNDYANRNVVFDMGGHTLRVGGAESAGKQYVRGNRGTTYVFTNGTFWCSKDGSQTNSVYSSGNSTNDMSIVAIGSDTTLLSSFALSNGKNISLHILNGAKAYGNLFGFGGSGEICGEGSLVRFAGSCYVGTLDSNVYGERNNPPHGQTLLVDGATLTSESPTTKGSVYVGNGNYSYGNTLVATNGASVAARTIYVGAGGVNEGILYTSSNNTLKVTGTGTAITAKGANDGGILHCGYGYSSGNLVLVENGASVDVNYIYAGCNKNALYAPSNNTIRAAGAATTVTVATDIKCGSGCSSNNSFVFEDGVNVSANTFHIGCDGASSNNTFRATGAGTKVIGRFFVGGEKIGATNSFCNSAIFENGAMMTNTILGVNTYGTGNTVTIRSGATAITTSEVDIGGRSPSSGNDYNGACGRLEVVGAGTTLTAPMFNIRNNTGDASKGQELFVGDGACVTNNNENGIRFLGDGNRVVVSNGTLSAKVLYPNGLTIKNVQHPATNTTFRIEGANARLEINKVRNVAGNDNQLVGAPIFEFKIPEGGWASAPVAINQQFTIGDDTVIKIDAASAKAFARASGGGTVPLIRSTASTPKITADVEKLTAGADLPAGCSLQNENGVLSVKVEPKSGMVLVVW